MPNIETVFLFGGTSLMGSFRESLLEMGYTVHAFTAPRQAETCGIQPEDLIVCERPDEALASLKVSKNCIGIGIGEAWKFSNSVRKKFGNRLVDFMSIPLPRYVGGAHISHAILREEFQWGCSIQTVTENTKPGEIHDGLILYKGDIPLSGRLRGKALDDELNSRYLAFLRNFIKNLEVGFVPTRLAGDLLYLPRLNTLHQSWIDWSWDERDLVSFIGAFDSPYPGARTMLRDNIITIHDVRAADGHYHPFQAGLIVSLSNGMAKIAVKHGAIEASLRFDGRIAGDLKPGLRLVTNRTLLDHAMLYEPDYTPTGDANAR